MCIEPSCKALTEVIKARQACITAGVEATPTTEKIACVTGDDTECTANSGDEDRFQSLTLLKNTHQHTRVKLESRRLRERVLGSRLASAASARTPAPAPAPTPTPTPTPAPAPTPGWKFKQEYKFCSKDYDDEKEEAYADYRAMAMDLQSNLLYYANPANKDEDDKIHGHPPPCTADEYTLSLKAVANWLTPKLDGEICPEDDSCSGAAHLTTQLTTFAYTMESGEYSGR